MSMYRVYEHACSQERQYAEFVSSYSLLALGNSANADRCSGISSWRRLRRLTLHWMPRSSNILRSRFQKRQISNNDSIRLATSVPDVSDNVVRSHMRFILSLIWFNYAINYASLHNNFNSAHSLQRISYNPFKTCSIWRGVPWITVETSINFCECELGQCCMVEHGGLSILVQAIDILKLDFITYMWY